MMDTSSSQVFAIFVELKGEKKSIRLDNNVEIAQQQSISLFNAMRTPHIAKIKRATKIRNLLVAGWVSPKRFVQGRVRPYEHGCLLFVVH